MKYLVIGALIVLLLLVVYSRIHPYLKLFGKILGTAKSIVDPQASGTTTRNASVDGKLVKCVACGTWIPSSRAFGSKSSTTPYCSKECLEKSAASGRHKAAS